jgi:hypothetical protein
MHVFFFRHLSPSYYNKLCYFESGEGSIFHLFNYLLWPSSSTTGTWYIVLKETNRNIHELPDFAGI